MQNPELGKTSLRTNSSSKEKKPHLPYVPSFLSWLPMSFPPVSSPAWGTPESLGEHCRALSSRSECAFLDAHVPLWNSGRCTRPGQTKSPLFWFFHLIKLGIPCVLQSRLRENQGSHTSGSQGLFSWSSAENKWKQNGRLSNSACFVLFTCIWKSWTWASWLVHQQCFQWAALVWSALDFKTFYLFHLSVISLTSIKVLAAIQESRLCKLADIFSNACNQDFYGHFIPANWKLLNMKAAWCAPKAFLILVVPICVGYWSQSLLWLFFVEGLCSMTLMKNLTLVVNCRGSF